MKISELNLAGAIAGTEVFPIVQGGETKKVSIADALAGAGGVPTLQQVTDVTNGNKTTTDIYNYFDIANNYSRLTNDIDGGGSQTPGLEIQKTNSNGLSRVLLNVHNNNPSIDDYQDSYIYFETNPTIGLANQVQLGSNAITGEITQQLNFQVNTIGNFSLLWNYPSQTPKIRYNDINSGNSTSLEFSNSLIKTTYNDILNGLSLDFANDEYYLGQVQTLNNVVKVSNGIVEIYATNQIYVTSGNSGLSINNIDGITTIGDIANDNNQNQFFIDDNSSKIYTKSQGNENGLSLDFASDIYSFGDYNNVDYLSINKNNGNTILRAGNSIVLYQGRAGLNLQNGVSILCDPDGNGNSSFFGLDDINQTVCGSANLITTNNGSAVNEHLKINLGGTDYVIQLRLA
jgi:hypothetical protein